MYDPGQKNNQPNYNTYNTNTVPDLTVGILFFLKLYSAKLLPCLFEKKMRHHCCKNDCAVSLL